MLTAEAISARLELLGDPQAACFALRFFKTGSGEYGEGDLFRGIRVPVLRKLAPALDNVPPEEVIRLLASAFHEDRLLALLLLIRRFRKADGVEQERIYNSYLANTLHINNWDLVDISAEHIVGSFLRNRDRAPLYRLAVSESLWERRIAIVSTFHFIRCNEFHDTLAIAGMLLNDPEELIHKAAGWMLREVGKRDQPAEEEFLRVHCRRMPRVMLRYAIERFEEGKRQRYLKGLV
ncbi:DNA alkylation repair protein [Chlorobium sp. BLA1]|uniref:DNA alkylation repair protein n=1 Tax=Candidatus Chlorobium masyuteum TaxID=2716876 RepID=UPI0014236287|nr:DNA alkylation repair protein [Candidatus Chlorobium masyuteum]NHQ60854.1 DNA alkylation repair protein [Candidatus Chlorobium masyuteum]